MRRLRYTRDFGEHYKSEVIITVLGDFRALFDLAPYFSSVLGIFIPSLSDERS